MSLFSKVKELKEMYSLYWDEAERRAHVKTEKALKKIGYTQEQIDNYRKDVAKKKGKSYEEFMAWLNYEAKDE